MPGPPRTIDLSRRGVPFADQPRNVRTIQDAIDELGDQTVGGSFATVILPDDDVPIDRPIFLDRAGVGLEGKGKGVSRLVATMGHDALVTGVQRRPAVPGGYIPPGLDHFPDLHTSGWLPGNTTGRGQRYCFRTKADHHLAQQGGPLDDFPAGVTGLTVEMALDFSRLRAPGGSWASSGSASLCGLTEKGTPSPWDAVIGQESVIFRLRSESGVRAECSVAAWPGFAKLTFQVDLARRDVSAWLDDRKVRVTGSIPEGFDTFAANQHCPFGVGSNSLTANAVADSFGGASDVTFAGLRVTLRPLYAGDRLARIDGGPVYEARFFTLEVGVKGFLNLTDDPGLMITSRVASATAADYGRSTLYLLDNAAHVSDYSATAPGPIRHLSLVCNRPQGRGLAVGYVNNLRVEDVEVRGGRHGIGSINFGPTYPAAFLDCDLSATDSPLYLFNTLFVTIDRMNLPSGFRCGIRLVDSQGTIRNVFAPCWGISDHYLRAIRSSFVLEDSNFDNESAQGAQVAPIYCLPGGVFPIICRVNRCSFASYGKDAPLALLDDVANPDDFPHAMRFGMLDCADVLRGGGIIEAAKRWEVTKDW